MNPCKRYIVTAIGWNESSKKVVTRNYNETECTGEVGNCGCIHAEDVLIRELPDLRYCLVSISPCLNCAKLLVEAGVKEVHYYQEYRKKDGIEYLKQNGVKVGIYQ